MLVLLRDLYALDRIWKDIGTYRNQDYVAPNKAKVKKDVLRPLTPDSLGFLSGDCQKIRNCR